MTKYADKECRRCHIILPAPEMHKHTGERKSFSNAVSRPQYQRKGRPNPRITTSTRTSSYTYFLCDECHRRKLKRDWTIRGIIALVFLLVYVSSMSKDRKIEAVATERSSGATDEKLTSEHRGSHAIHRGQGTSAKVPAESSEPAINEIGLLGAQASPDGSGTDQPR